MMTEARNEAEHWLDQREEAHYWFTLQDFKDIVMLYGASLVVEDLKDMAPEVYNSLLDVIAYREIEAFVDWDDNEEQAMPTV